MDLNDLTLEDIMAFKHLTRLAESHKLVHITVDFLGGVHLAYEDGEYQEYLSPIGIDLRMVQLQGGQVPFGGSLLGGGEDSDVEDGSCGPS
jgi:hypothetical protein